MQTCWLNCRIRESCDIAVVAQPLKTIAVTTAVQRVVDDNPNRSVGGQATVHCEIASTFLTYVDPMQILMAAHSPPCCAQRTPPRSSFWFVFLLFGDEDHGRSES